MGWEFDLVVYAILFVIFAVAKGNAKKICILISVAFAAISCVIYSEITRFMIIPHIAIGAFAVAWIVIAEKRKANSKKASSKNKTNPYESVVKEEPHGVTTDDDIVEYDNISLHDTQTLKSAHIKGNIEKFTITIDTVSGPIYFLVENGVITSHYIEARKTCKQYEVN